MHEISLCENVLRVLEENASSQGYQQVKTVRLEIGDLAGVEISALRFGFDVVMRGTLADNAQLEIVPVPGTAWCMQCATTISLKTRFDACSRCGSRRLQITAGGDMRIKELEVE